MLQRYNKSLFVIFVLVISFCIFVGKCNAQETFAECLDEQRDDDDGVTLLSNACTLTANDSIWHDADVDHNFCRETVNVGCNKSADCLGRCGPGCGATGKGVYSVDCAEHDQCCRTHGDCLNPLDKECGDEWREAADDFLFGTENCAGCPPIDLVFVIDTTGSMWDDIQAAKVSAIDILNQMSAQTSDFRIAIVSFEDFPVDPYGDASWGDYMYHDVLNFTNDKTQIISAINGLFTRNGNDWEESHYSAMMHTFQKNALGGWRDNVKKVAIVMTDAPPHDPEPFTGYTSQDVINAAIALDPVVIYPITVGWDDTTKSYMEKLAVGTEGMTFEAANSGQVVQAIMAAIETSFSAPTANAGGPYSGSTKNGITFDASLSFDSDGSIVSYAWDWNNDEIYDETTGLPTVIHLWDVPYSGLIKLKVTDDSGLTAISTAIVKITIKGDLNKDGIIDKNDVNIIYNNRNKPASAYPDCDIDGDDTITILDARKLTTMCTYPLCASK